MTLQNIRTGTNNIFNILVVFLMEKDTEHRNNITKSFVADSKKNREWNYGGKNFA